MSDELELLRERYRHRDEMNLVLGVATGLMTKLGLPWKERVAWLCNFAGDRDEIVRQWDSANVDAHRLLDALLPPADEDEPVDER